MLVPELCRMPPRSELDAADALGGNRQYEDLRGFGWRDVSSLLSLERELLPLLVKSQDERTTIARFAYERFLAVNHPNLRDDDIVQFVEEHCDENIYCYLLSLLDGGMASIVCALSAARCVPVYSCNGGALSEGRTGHAAHYPIVSFYAHYSACNLLNSTAIETGAQVEHQGDLAVIGARTIEEMIAAARYMQKMHRVVGMNTRNSKIRNQPAERQQTLPFLDGH